VDLFTARIATDPAADRTAMLDAQRALARFLAAFAGDLGAERMSASDPRNDILVAADALLRLPRDLAARADSSITANELLELAERFDANANQFQSLIDGAIATEERAIATLHEETRKAQARATWLIGSSVALLVLAMLVVGYAIASRIAEPIGR